MHRKLIIIIIIIFMHSKLTQVCGKADSRRKALDMIRTKITEVPHQGVDHGHGVAIVKNGLRRPLFLQCPSLTSFPWMSSLKGSVHRFHRQDGWGLVMPVAQGSGSQTWRSSDMRV
ncbi:hypothetical protein M8J76_010879 [Diaphorina citri]|nr:hypothetical protein M8J76_010879 [Diaphorina citri]